MSTIDTERLAEDILAAAQSDDASGDGRLPTERRLAADFGVSRTTVRRALSLLEADGLLSREVGRGTFIRDSAPATPMTGVGDLTNISPADVMAVRSLLEPAAMPIVVTRATAQDFLEIDRCLERGDAAETYADFEIWDMAFHRAIIQASHNPLLVRLYAEVDSARHTQLFGELKRRHDSAAKRARYQAQHRAVAEAARSRDADEAVMAMRAHLSDVTTSLFGRLL